MTQYDTLYTQIYDAIQYDTKKYDTIRLSCVAKSCENLRNCAITTITTRTTTTTSSCMEPLVTVAMATESEQPHCGSVILIIGR